MTSIQLPPPPRTLAELLRYLKDRVVWEGAPMSNGELDMSDLPVFGGYEPVPTDCVWSWDEDHLLVGTDPEDFEIITRKPPRLP